MSFRKQLFRFFLFLNLCKKFQNIENDRRQHQIREDRKRGSRCRRRRHHHPEGGTASRTRGGPRFDVLYQILRIKNRDQQLFCHKLYLV